MKKRRLGELEVAAIGLGCMSMSQAYGTPDREESERALHRALDQGYTFLDTASIYGLGHNEALIGKVLKDRRQEFVLASKCGITAGSDGRRGVDGRPEQIKKTCDESLQRLNTDMIDLYYLHRRDHKVPIEDSVGALADLHAAGKIRAIGLSEVSSTTLRRAHRVHPIAAVQSEYSLWTRDPEEAVLDACRDLGVGFVPFSPVGRGFLTGAVRDRSRLEKGDMRRAMPRFQEENLRQNLGWLADFAQLAQKNRCTPAQLALAWLLSRGEHVVPIPGTKHVRYVDENAAAADLEIPAADLARAGELIGPGTVAGERYAPAQRISLDPERPAVAPLRPVRDTSVEIRP